MSQLAGARAALRLRSGFEAVDLGFQMARVWWRPLAATWLALVLPLGVSLIFALRDHPVWSIALLWWLRPVFARVPLHVLSRLLFGEAASVREAALALPRLLRSGLGTSLFLQRFSPARTMLLPVLQLEGLRGAARRQRCILLVRRDLGAAAGLLTAGAHFNAALLLGLLLVAELFVPSELELTPFAAGLGAVSVPAFLPLLYWLGVSLIEPVLVAGGFALYLNRRVFLEGWDIELAFRRLGGRAPARRGIGPLAALLALLLAGDAARAGVCDPTEPASAAPCIQSVLEHPDFGSKHKELRWMPKQLDRDTKPIEVPWLLSFAQVMARIAELALWAAAAGAIIGLALLLLRVRPPKERAAAPVPSAVRLMGLDLDPRSLPPDVVAAARACFERGEWIAALSLLYRGALVRLAARGALDVPESATELECVRLVQSTQREATARAFAALTRSWVGARYAHEPPTRDEFEAICNGFGSAFEATP